MGTRSDFFPSATCFNWFNRYLYVGYMNVLSKSTIRCCHLTNALLATISAWLSLTIQPAEASNWDGKQGLNKIQSADKCTMCTQLTLSEYLVVYLIQTVTFTFSHIGCPQRHTPQWRVSSQRCLDRYL